MGFEVIMQDKNSVKSGTKTRVIKSNDVKVTEPRLLDTKTIGFQFLVDSIPILRTTEEPSTLIITEVDDDPTLETSKVAYDEVLSKANDEASAIIAEAKSQAKGILEQAKIETEDLRNRLEAELDALEKLKAQVHEEVSRQAYSEGFVQGEVQGYSDGKEKWVQEAITIKEEAEKVLTLAKRAFEVEFTKVDASLVNFAVQIAERIVHTSIGIDPKLLLNRIRSLSLLPEEQDGWKLHVAPQDANWLMSLPQESKLTIPFVKDANLKQGDCYLECQEGVFTANIRSQLDRFEKLLREDLANARLD